MACRVGMGCGNEAGMWHVGWGGGVEVSRVCEDVLRCVGVYWSV